VTTPPPLPVPLRKLLEPTEGIIIGGKRYPLPGRRVLTWREHGQRFQAGEGFNTRRTRRCDLFVWHWSGAENAPLVMVDTLRKRKLGVHFAIDGDADATIYQFADPMAVACAHAGDVNGRSLGCEVVSYGVKSWDRAWITPPRGRDRAMEMQRIHGKDVSVAAFRPQQIASAQALANLCSYVLGIPRSIPRDGNGEVDGDLFGPERMAQWKGHCGHLHVSAKKLDPGLALLEELFPSIVEVA
jgi:hypothetical protein